MNDAIATSFRDPEQDGNELLARFVHWSGETAGLWQCGSDQSPFEQVCRYEWNKQTPALSAAGAEFPCDAFPPTESSIICESWVKVDDDIVVLDVCDAIEEYGCTIGDAVNGRRYCEFENLTDSPFLAQEERAMACAARHLCWSPPDEIADDANDQPSLFASSDLDTDIRADRLLTYGDLSCSTGEGSVALGFYRQADTKDRPTTADLLESRLDDLDRAHLPPDVQGNSNIARLTELFTSSGQCLDAGRFYSALTWSLSDHIQLATGESSDVQPSAQGGAMGQRLLQQWLDVHAFVAREGLQTDELARILTGNEEANVTSPRTLEEMLTTSLNGWDLLLHPRILGALTTLRTSVLRSPVYREYLAEKTLPDTREPYHEQGIGLPVNMLRTLEVQLGTATQIVRRARFAANGEQAALAQVSNTLRYAALVAPLALWLHERAAAAQSVAWDERYLAALQMMRANQSLLIQESYALIEGRNPLGIEEGDLPLYFDGDPQGPSERFSAISNYLLGDSLSELSESWAASAVTRAEQSLEKAREEWTKIRTRKFAVALAKSDNERRLEALNLRWGEQITSACNNPGWSSYTILEDWTGQAPHTVNDCFIDTSEPACNYTPDAIYDLVKKDDAAHALCVVQKLRQNLGSEVKLGKEDAIHEAMRQSVRLIVSGVTGEGEKRTLTAKPAKGSSIELPVARLYEADYGPATPEQIVSARQACSSSFSLARERLAGLRDLPDSPLAQPECFVGSLGQSAFEIEQTRLALERSRSQAGEFIRNYDIALSSCERQAQANEVRSILGNQHRIIMTLLNATKLAIDIATTTIDEFSGDDGWIKKATGIAAAQSVLKGSSLTLALSMEEAQRYHDAEISGIDSAADLDRCFIEARSHLVGAETAALEVEEAVLDLTGAVSRFRSEQLGLQALVDEGRAALSNENVRVDEVGESVAPAVNDMWLSEKIDRFRREMVLAKRVVYLGVRAVEYEYQQSLSERGIVLAALTPTELREALDSLLTNAAT